MKINEITADYIKANFDSLQALDDYLENIMPNYPESPSKPKKPDSKNPDDYRAYASHLEDYNEQYNEYREKLNLHKVAENHKDILIEYFIKLECQLDKVPEQYRAKVWAKAYEDGHSHGYGEVYNKLLSLVEIFE